MSVWGEVQEQLYERFAAAWGARTPYCFGNETFDPPAGPWARLAILASPSGLSTLGAPGQRRWERAGHVFVSLYEPPAGGVRSLSDLAEAARAIFEGIRIDPHDVRFAQADIGGEQQVDEGRWWGVTLDAPFVYEEIR